MAQIKNPAFRRRFQKKKTFDGLSERDKRVWFLHKTQNLSAAEISVTMDLSASRIREIIRNIKEILA